MSKSYDRLVDAAIETLRAHVLPITTDDFSRGQLFSVIFALNFLKSAGDWKIGPLQAQIRVQDAAFAAIARLAPEVHDLSIPTAPRRARDDTDAASVEALRDEGDRLIGLLLTRLADDPTIPFDDASQMTRILRQAVRDQLKVEMELVPKSMLNAIATGEDMT